MCIRDRTTITTHIKEKHGEGKRVQCPQCDFTTLRKRNLGKHVRAKHEEKILSYCDQCEYKTDKPGKLTRHMETHI